MADDGNGAAREDILKRLKHGHKSKRELADGEPHGTFNRALEQLKRRALVVSTREGYAHLRQANYCVACGDPIPEGSGRCGDRDCLQPQQRVKCRQCLEWFVIDAYPLPLSFHADREATEEDPDPLLEPFGEGVQKYRAGLLEDTDMGDDRTDPDWCCPACAWQWEPPEPWPYPKREGWIPHDDAAYDDMLEVIHGDSHPLDDLEDLS